MAEQPPINVIATPVPAPSYPSSYDYSAFSDNGLPAGFADAVYLQARILACEDGTKTAQILEQCREWYQKHPEILKRVLGAAAYADSLRVTHPNWAYWDMFNANEANHFEANQQTELTNNAFGPLAALYHYIYGDGLPLSADMTRLSFNFDRQTLPPVNTILSTVQTGTFPINEKIGYDFRNSSYWEWAYLGRVSLTLQGTLKVEPNGQWTFDGGVVGTHDRYDANKDVSRGKVGELLTDVLRAIPGTEYDINLNGEHVIHLSGQR